MGISMKSAVAIASVSFILSFIPAGLASAQAEDCTNIFLTEGQDLNPFYDGTPKPVLFDTIPPELEYSVTYNGGSDAPTDAGSYSVLATITDGEISGSCNTALAIQELNTDITITNADSLSSVSTSVGHPYTVTWSVDVESPGAGTPTGTVTVTADDGTSCSAPVGSNQCDIEPTTAGEKTITASYSDEAGNYNGSNTESPATHTVTERKNTTQSGTPAYLLGGGGGNSSTEASSPGTTQAGNPTPNVPENQEDVSGVDNHFAIAGTEETTPEETSSTSDQVAAAGAADTNNIPSWVWLLILAFLILAGGGFYFFSKKTQP